MFCDPYDQKNLLTCFSLRWVSIKEVARRYSLAFQSDCRLQSRRSASCFSPFYWSCLAQAWQWEILQCSFLPWQNSLTRRAPIPSDAQGRSGARFHTSYNKRYVIKIITSEDVAEMHNILKKYHQVEGKSVPLNKENYPIVSLTSCEVSSESFFVLYLPNVVYSRVPWKHAAPSVSGHVSPHSGWRWDLHDRHSQCFQPPAACLQKIWPEGEWFLFQEWIGAS